MIKRAGITLIIVLLLAIPLSLLTGCYKEIPASQTGQDVQDMADQESSNVKLESGQDESGSEAAAVEPTPFPTPRYDPFQVILDYGGFNDEMKEYILDLVKKDPNADWIYSIADMIVSEEMAETDILHLTVVILDYIAEPIDEFFGNTLFPCGEDIEGGFVICTDDPQPIEPGRVYLVMMKLAEDVPPSSSDRFYTYSVVFDADGDETNNFLFNPPYDWDYYQNTDRWYTLDWVPSEGWKVNVYDAVTNIYGVPSGVRAVVMGDIVAFFIPASEFSVESPGYRVTAFGHDGTYAPEVSCGDVSGANPTEPLLQIQGEAILLE